MTLVFAGLRKLRTRTASRVALIVAALLASLLLVLIGWSMSLPTEQSGTGAASRETMVWFVTFPGAYDAVLALVFAYGGLVAMIYAAAVAGTEWSWGTLKVAVMRGESRTRYVVATYLALAILLAVGVLGAFLAGAVGAVVGGLAAGVSPGNFTEGNALPHLADALFRCWIAVCCLGAVGYAIAMIARSQMAGVGTVIGVYIASLFAPLVKPLEGFFNYLPFSVSSMAMNLQGPPGTSSAAPAIEPNFALLVTLGWIALCLAVAAVATERAEIGG